MEPAADHPLVDVVIVNWNAGRQLEACVRSLAGAAGRGFRLDRLVIVDNASADESLRGLDAHELNLQILRNPENRGFARACNQGAAGSRAQYLLFLNPDVRVEPSSIEVPIRGLEAPAGQRWGAVGISLVGDDERIARTCARAPTPRMFVAQMLGLDRLAPSVFRSHVMSEWDHAASRQVDHVIGAFYLVRRSVFESLRGFDERFFVYLEDLDLSVRIGKAGWQIMFLADARAYHRGGGTSAQAKAARLFYALSSRIAFGYKHFDRATAAALALATLTVEPVIRAGRALLTGDIRQFRDLSGAFRRLWLAPLGPRGRDQTGAP